MKSLNLTSQQTLRTALPYPHRRPFIINSPLLYTFIPAVPSFLSSASVSIFPRINVGRSSFSAAFTRPDIGMFRTRVVPLTVTVHIRGVSTMRSPTGWLWLYPAVRFSFPRAFSRVLPQFLTKFIAIINHRCHLGSIRRMVVDPDQRTADHDRSHGRKGGISVQVLACRDAVA